MGQKKSEQMLQKSNRCDRISVGERYSHFEEIKITNI